MNRLRKNAKTFSLNKIQLAAGNRSHNRRGSGNALLPVGFVAEGAEDEGDSDVAAGNTKSYGKHDGKQHGR